MKTFLKYFFLPVVQVFFVHFESFPQLVKLSNESTFNYTILPLKETPVFLLSDKYQNGLRFNVLKENIIQSPTTNNCGYYIDRLISFPGFGLVNVVSCDRLVSPESNSGSEISVCVKPSQKEIVREINMNDPQANIDYSFSNNQGETWNATNLSFSGAFADPTIAFNRNGTLFSSFLVDNEDWACKNAAVGIGIYDAVNQVWMGPYYVTEIPAGYNQDKPHLTVDNSVNNGNLYCGWTPMSCYHTPDGNYGILISRSTNNGFNWDSPQLISQDLYSPDLTVNHGVNIQTGPNGEVYAVWAATDWRSDSYSDELIGHQDETALVFARSLNHGVSYEGDGQYGRLIIPIHGIANYHADVSGWNFAGGQMRLNSFPSMCVDKSGGPANGRIYIVWANHGPTDNLTYTGDRIDVYMIYSDDQGSSWSHEQSTPIPPIMVDSAVLEGKHSFFPWISCDNESGNLTVIFYDDSDPEIFSGEYVEAFVAMSKDHGQTWENSRVSDYQFRSPQSGFFGDYIGICSQNGLVYPTFTDTHNSDDENCLPQVYVSPFYAWNCVTNYPNSSDLVSVNQTIQSNQIREWEVSDYINSKNTVQDDGTAIYNAGDEIIFLAPDVNNPTGPGFYAASGSYVYAHIEGCTPFSTNCSGDNTVLAKGNKILKSGSVKSLQPEIQICPNPSSGKFNVTILNSNNQSFKGEVINALGSSIYSLPVIEKPIFDVDISEYSKGIYFLKLYADNKVYMKKVIID